MVFTNGSFIVFQTSLVFKLNGGGRVWQTSEHAYQASHFFETAPELVEQIFQANSAHEAYKLAKANTDRAPENWDEKKVTIMEDIIRHKLEQNPYILHKLRQTGGLLIVEDSPKDDFWGWGPKRDGRNELGKIWMKLRDELVTK